MAELVRLCDEAASRRHVPHLLHANRQRDVALASGDGVGRVADGVHARRAVVGHAGNRDVAKAERLGDGRAGVALHVVSEGKCGPQPRPLDVGWFNVGVGEGLEPGLHHHIEIALIEVLAELAAPEADNGYFTCYWHLFSPFLTLCPGTLLSYS